MHPGMSCWHGCLHMHCRLCRLSAPLPHAFSWAAMHSMSCYPARTTPGRLACRPHASKAAACVTLPACKELKIHINTYLHTCIALYCR